MHFPPLSESETQGMQMVFLQEWSSSLRKLVRHVPTGECPHMPAVTLACLGYFIEHHLPMRPSEEPHLRIRLCRHHHHHPWLCSLPVWSGSSGGRQHLPGSVLQVLQDQLSRARQADKESATRGESSESKSFRVSACNLDSRLKLASPCYPSETGVCKSHLEVFSVLPFARLMMNKR